MNRTTKRTYFCSLLCRWKGSLTSIWKSVFSLSCFPNKSQNKVKQFILAWTFYDVGMAFEWLATHCFKLNTTINVAFSCQCSNVLLFGITRLRLSWERIKNCLFIHALSWTIHKKSSDLKCLVFIPPSKPGQPSWPPGLIRNSRTGQANP